MTHDYKRTSWYKEGAISLFTGFLFGAANTLVGHPFDTIKTKMQAQTEHLASNSGYIDTVKRVYAREGAIGFYRGCIPPFFGSIIYRSLQFSVYEMFYTKWENDQKMKQTIPLSGGI